MSKLTNEQKKGLWTALLELLSAVFTIGKTHIEKNTTTTNLNG